MKKITLSKPRRLEGEEIKARTIREGSLLVIGAMEEPFAEKEIVLGVNAGGIKTLPTNQPALDQLRVYCYRYQNRMSSLDLNKVQIIQRNRRFPEIDGYYNDLLTKLADYKKTE